MKARSRMSLEVFGESKDQPGRGDTGSSGEKWHVIPLALGGSDSNDNIVYLTPREHFICYKILSKLYPDVFELYCEKITIT